MKKAEKKTEQPKRNQRPTSFRLSPEGKALLATLSETLGISQAAVLEQAIRQMARREKIRRLFGATPLPDKTLEETAEEKPAAEPAAKKATRKRREK
ncbi:MAG TPA: hypothetical protein VH682_03390 [Gemmataceae bacterium]